MIINSKKKTIIIFEPFPFEMTAKLARALRLNGYYTILIYCNEGTAEGNTFLEKAYNEIIPLNDSKTRGIKSIPQVVKMVKEIKPYAFIYISLPEIPGVLLKFLLKDICPFVYFPYDIISVVPQVLDTFRKKIKYFFEIRAQKFLLKSSDGIIHKGY
ncbi:MAG: hypothetical protein Q8L27_04925, partial [archaeon]|nr:hypothetical protein [archaeon]